MPETYRPAHSAESHVPHEEFVEGDRLKIVIAGLDDNVHTHAVEAANRQMTAKLNEHGSGFGGFIKKMWRSTWHGGAMREYYHSKYTQENERRAYESGDIEHYLSEDARDKQLELETTKRWAQAFDENLRQDLLSPEEIETFGLVLDQNPDGSENAEGKALKEQITELIDDYVSGDIADEDAFNEQSKRLLNDAAQSGAHSDMIGRAQLRISNLFQVAQNVQAIKMREESLGRDTSVHDIMRDADIIMGSAKVGPETKAHINRVERCVEHLRKVPLLKTLNESTVATAATIAYSIGGWATKTAVGSAAAVFAAGSAAGIWSGLREARQLKEERAQHFREVERGEINPNDITGKRREALETTRYESKSATELTEQLQLLYDETTGEFRVNDEDSFKEALQIIAEIEARNNLSSEREVALIHYSKGQMARERRLLRVELATAKTNMNHLLNDADHALLTEFGLNPDDIDRVKANPDEKPIDFVLDPIRDGNEGVLGSNVFGELNEELKAKDSLYRRLQAKRVAAAVVKGTLLGVGIGTTVQELVVAPLSDNTQGVVERLWSPGNPEAGRQTLLDAVFNPEQPVHMSDHYSTLTLPGSETQVTLPDNLQIQQTGEHTFAINGHDINISDLKTNADGTLTPEARATLAEAGFNIGREGTVFGPPDIIQHNVNANPNSIVQNHSDLTTHVNRDYWYYNDTPMRWENGHLVGADHNELGLWNPTRDANGNIHIRTNMTENGSWTGAERANWAQLASEGKLQVALSLSNGTQHEVFMVPINANGEAIINSDTVPARFFTEGQGEVSFMGKFTEVVEIRGVDPDGTTHIAPLATDVGRGLNSIPDVVTEAKPHAMTEYALDYQPNRDPIVSVPPVLPWYPRKGLELISLTPRNIRRRTPYIYDYGDYPEPTPSPRPPSSDNVQIVPSSEYISSYYDGPPKDAEYYRSRMSPRFAEANNPDVELNEREEFTWYWNQQTPEHQANVIDLAQQIPALSAEAEIVIAIPVAGHQENDNIYRTLSGYLNQSAANNRFEIVLYVNHPETDPEGNPTSAQATIDEINRFKRDHPELNVHYIYEKLPRSEAKIGLIRKKLSDVIIKRGLDRHSSASAPTKDIVIVSNDADTLRVADTYIENFLDKFDNNPDIDAFVGQLDWDNESFLRYPEIHIGTRLFLYNSVQYRQLGGGLSSSGANFAYRAKNYAAVRGYSTDASIGEDIQFGHAIAAARKGAKTKKPVGFAGNSASRLETSARRSIYVLESFNDAPINQWDYSFGADDDAVRRIVTARGKPDLSNPADRAMIISNIENIVNRSLKVYGANFKTDSSGRRVHSNDYLQRSLKFCGLDFDWDDAGKLHINDASRMFEGLIAFERRHQTRATA